MKNNLTRRRFIQATGSWMLLEMGMLMSGCTERKEIKGEAPPASNPTPTPTPAPTPGTGQKALVFIMLDGGNDSFNMLVPTSTAAYNEYRTNRGNLALSQSSLLPLNNFRDARGRTFGLHSKMPKVQNLFHQKKLSFVANMAPLIQPVTRAEFVSGSKPLPVGLMSHSDQFKHWQTARPGERINRGWFGGCADLLQPGKESEQISMNISLAGSNIMQNGKQSREYSITSRGSVGLKVKDRSNPETAALNAELLDGVEAILQKNYSSMFADTYIQGTRYAQTQHERFKEVVDPITVNTNFAGADNKVSELAAQLKMVAKAIKAGPELGVKQQTFFLRYIGWDHHSELLNKHGSMLQVLDDALAAFQKALAELDIEDKVITFTGSDFGRSLTSNGNGTDHGWGGNNLVMGLDIDGGKIFGEYPSLNTGSANPLDIGDGVLIPTTATDELYADLALWFGIQRQNLGQLFPNLHHFYDLNSTAAPLGVIRSS